MASSKPQMKIMLETEQFEEVCEAAVARNVSPGEILREILEKCLDEFREAESDPAAMRELMKKLVVKDATVH